MTIRVMFQRAFLLALLVPVAAGAISVSETLHGQRLRATSGSVEQARNIARYAAYCSSKVDDALGCTRTPRRYIEIREYPEAGYPVADNAYQVNFGPGTGILEFTYITMLSLVTRRVAELGRESGGALSRFVASALAYRQVMGIRGLRGSMSGLDYQAARRQFSEGFFPRARLLFSAPMAPSFPGLFQLYAMHSALLLQCIESIPVRRGTTLMRLLEMESYGREAGEAAEFVLGGELPSGMTLQGWYERQVQIAVKSDHSAGGGRSIMSRIRELETVPVLSASAAGGVSYVPLEKIPDAFSSLKMDGKAVMKHQLRFMELSSEAPPLLKKPLKMHADALARLASGDVRQFREQLATARAALAKACAKQRAVEDYLLEAERKHVSVYSRFATYFDIMERYRAIDEEAFPWQKNLETAEGR